MEEENSRSGICEIKKEGGRSGRERASRYHVMEKEEKSGKLLAGL